MSNDALIGHTGFVGSNLLRGWRFEACFNSKNIADIRDRHFGTVVCAGVSAVKWLANKEPATDLAGIQALRDHLQTIKADRFVLISTVDVYPSPIGVTEADDPDAEAAQPYGRHRLELERWIAGHFPVVSVVRLPALFGPGLKKNILFDLMNQHMTSSINPNGEFQWYPLRRFASDLRTIVASGLPLVNLAVEPVRTDLIAGRFFPGAAIGAPDMPSHRYDIWTQHPGLLGGQGRYHLDQATVLNELQGYLAGADH